MSNYREYAFHFLAGFLFLYSIFIIIPNLSLELKNYEEVRKIIKSVRIYDGENKDKYLQKSTQRILVIVMTDQTELEFGASEYSKFFKELQDKKNIGKVIKYYTRRYTADNFNPIQVEIDNKIIYDINERRRMKYAMLLITFVFSICSIFRLLIIFKWNK